MKTRIIIKHKWEYIAELPEPFLGHSGDIITLKGEKYLVMDIDWDYDQKEVRVVVREL